MKKPKNEQLTNLEVSNFPKPLLISINELARRINKTRRAFVISEFKKIVEQYKQNKS